MDIDFPPIFQCIFLYARLTLVWRDCSGYHDPYYRRCRPSLSTIHSAPGICLGGSLQTHSSGSLEQNCNSTRANSKLVLVSHEHCLVPSLSLVLSVLSRLSGRYIDSILPDEFGVSESALFFLSRTYWKRDKQSKDLDLAAWLERVQQEYRKKSKLKERRYWPFSAARESRTTDSVFDAIPNADASAIHNKAIDLSVPAGLRVVHLRKQFRGGCIAIHDVSFSMQYGTLLAIVGANGSGKSTMCNVLCGAMPATAGDAVIDDRSRILDRYSATNMIGWCSQHDILFDELTPMEHVYAM